MDLNPGKGFEESLDFRTTYRDVLIIGTFILVERELVERTTISVTEPEDEITRESQDLVYPTREFGGEM